MTRDQSETVLKDEIVKCWDDGEVANYDRLVLLCEKTNVNTSIHSFCFIFIESESRLHYSHTHS